MKTIAQSFTTIRHVANLLWGPSDWGRKWLVWVQSESDPVDLFTPTSLMIFPSQCLMRCIVERKSAHVRAWRFVFYVSRSHFFWKSMRKREKTNKPPKNKHGTSKMKCEAVWWSRTWRSVHQRYHLHHSWNWAISLPRATVNWLVVQRNCRSPLPLFRNCSPSFSRPMSAWHSEQMCAREWSSNGGSTAPGHLLCPGQRLIFAHKVNTKKYSFGNSPWRYYPKFTKMSPSTATALQ